MTASYATDPGEMLGLIADLRAGLDDAAELVNGIIDGVDSVLAALPPEQTGSIRDGVADLERMFTTSVADLGQALDQAGDPVALRAAGAAWAVDIGGTVSGLAGLATDNMMRADNHWTGDAADAYRDALLPQRLAVSAVKTTGDKIDAVLHELANSITDFWAHVLGAVITLLAALVAALAVAAGGLTAPVALTMAAGALVAFSHAVVSHITMFTEITNAIAVQTKELVSISVDDTAYPGGAWPPAHATDMNDGSITDGDDTGWHIG